MSGGSFNYAYARVSQFADDLETRLEKLHEKDEWNQLPNYLDPDAEDAMREILRRAREMAVLMREAEWLYSGDTGENTFLERVKELL